MRILIIAAAIITMAGCSSSALDEVRSSRDPETVELIGIRAGMSPSDVQSSLKKRYPHYEVSAQVSEIAGRNYVETVFALLRPEGQPEKDRIEVRFTGPHSGNQVYSIARRRYLEGTERVPTEEIRKSLLEKYGSDFNKVDTSGGVNWVWIYGGERGERKTVCGEDTDLLVTPHFSVACGLEVAVREPWADQDGYSAQMEIRLVDHIAGRDSERLELQARDDFDTKARSQSLDPNASPDL